MGRGLRVEMALLLTGVMQRPHISTAPHLGDAGCPRTRGLEVLPPQHDGAVSCAACQSSAHPWACAELQWHASAQGGPVWRSGPAGPEHPPAGRPVPSPGQAFSVWLAAMSILTVGWQHLPAYALPPWLRWVGRWAAPGGALAPGRAAPPPPYQACRPCAWRRWPGSPAQHPRHALRAWVGSRPRFDARLRRAVGVAAGVPGRASGVCGVGGGNASLAVTSKSKTAPF